MQLNKQILHMWIENISTVTSNILHKIDVQMHFILFSSVSFIFLDSLYVNTMTSISNILNDA